MRSLAAFNHHKVWQISGAMHYSTEKKMIRISQWVGNTQAYFCMLYPDSTIAKIKDSIASIVGMHLK